MKLLGKEHNITGAITLGVVSGLAALAFGAEVKHFGFPDTWQHDLFEIVAPSARYGGGSVTEYRTKSGDMVFTHVFHGSDANPTFTEFSDYNGNGRLDGQDCVGQWNPGGRCTQRSATDADRDNYRAARAALDAQN